MATKHDYFVYASMPLLADDLDVKGWPTSAERRRIERGRKNGEKASVVTAEIIEERRKVNDEA